MKVKLVTSEFKERLAQLAAVISKKSPSPVYEHIRMVSDGTSVWLSGVAIDASLTIKLVKATADAPVDVLLPFGRLVDVTNPHTVDELSITVTDGTSATLKGGKASAKLRCFPLESWPEIMERPETETATLSLGAVKRHVDNVSFAITKKESRFATSVSKIESTEKSLRFVATDGFCLAFSELPANAGVFDLIIPKTAMDYVCKLSGEQVKLLVAETGFYFETEHEVLTVQRTHGAFPNYSAVLPKSFVQTLTVDAAALLGALKRVKPLADPETPVITFTTVENATSLLLVAVSTESEGSDEVDVVAQGPGVEVSLNANILQPYLERTTGKLTINISDKRSAVDFYAFEGQYRALIMPANVAAAAK